MTARRPSPLLLGAYAVYVVIVVSAFLQAAFGRLAGRLPSWTGTFIPGAAPVAFGLALIAYLVLPLSIAVVVPRRRRPAGR